MGGSTKTSSTQTNTPTAMADFRNVLDQAQSVASNTQYNPAMAMRVAGLDPYQTQGFEGIAGMQGRYSPEMSAALGTAANVAGGLNVSDISKFMSPYTQNVIDTTMANARQQQSQQLQEVVGNQIAQNAQGGNRAQLQKALTEGQFAQQNNATIAGLENAGYSQALQTALANNAQMLQGAYGVGNLAQAGQGMDMSQLSALIGAGNQLQGQTQSEYDAASANAREQTMWPAQMTQWLANITSGIGSQMGGTTTGTSKTQENPGAAQYAGMALSALAMFSDENLKENKRVIGKTFDGQKIYAFNYKGHPMTHLGLMAQEVIEKHPEAVGESDGWKTVNYDAATADAAKKHGFAAGGWPGAVAAPSQAQPQTGRDPWASLLQPMSIGNTQPQLQAPSGGGGQKRSDPAAEMKQWMEAGKKAKEGLSNIGGWTEKLVNSSGQGGWGAAVDTHGGSFGQNAMGALSNLGSFFGFADGGDVASADTLSIPDLYATAGLPVLKDLARTVDPAAYERRMSRNETPPPLPERGFRRLEAAPPLPERREAVLTPPLPERKGAVPWAGTYIHDQDRHDREIMASRLMESTGPGSRIESDETFKRLGGGDPYRGYLFSLAASGDEDAVNAVRAMMAGEAKNTPREMAHSMRRGFADGGDPSDSFWDTSPHDERFLWNPYAFKPLPNGGVDAHRAYDSMHMGDLPPIAGVKPTAPDPIDPLPPMAGPRPAPATPDEILPPLAGGKAEVETPRWTPTFAGADYRRTGATLKPLPLDPAGPDVMTPGRQAIDRLRNAWLGTPESNREAVRNILTGAGGATAEFGHNAWEAFKQILPEANSLSPEEAAEMRKEIAARPGVLEQLAPRLLPAAGELARGYASALKAGRDALPSAPSLPGSLTPEEAAQSRYERAVESGLPTHERLVPPPEASDPTPPEFSQGLRRPRGDVPEREGIGAGLENKGFGVTGQAISDFFNGPANAPATTFTRGAPFGMAASQASRPRPEMRELGLAPGALGSTIGLQPGASPEEAARGKSLGATVLERLFPSMHGKESEGVGDALNDWLSPPVKDADAPSLGASAAQLAGTQMAGPGVGEPQSVGMPTEIPAEVPAQAPYTAGLPAPKAEVDSATGEPTPMTARLGFEGRLGSVARDTGGMPSMGRYGIHAPKGQNASSAANFYSDHGDALGFRANPVSDPWGFAREWQRIAKENPEGLQQAEDAWYNKYVAGAGAAHLNSAGLPRDVFTDERVRDYMGDRLIQHGSNITRSAGQRYKQAWAGVSPESEDKAADFLRNLTAIDKAHTGHDFRTYIAENVGKHPDIQRTLENRVTNRFKGAMGQGAKPGDSPEVTEKPYKSTKELLPKEREHVGFLQRLINGENPAKGWNPLEPVIGPGKEGPGSDLLGWTPEQRERALRIGLGLMNGPFLSGAAKGATAALQGEREHSTNQQKLNLETYKVLADMARVPKYAGMHAVNPVTGETQFVTYDQRTGEGLFMQPQGAPVSESPQMDLLDSQAQQLVDGKLRLSQLPARVREPILLRAHQIDRTWSPADEETRFRFRDDWVKGSSVMGKKARALEAATRHLHGAFELSEKMGGGKFVPLNAGRNWASQNFGDNTVIRDYAVKVQGLSEELARLMSEAGVGSEAEKARWIEAFNPNFSPNQRKAALSSAIDLMKGQRDALDVQWQQVMGPAAKDWLPGSGRSREIMTGVQQSYAGRGAPAAVDQGAGQPATVSPPRQPPTISTKAEFEALPSGTKYRNARDGQLYVRP